MLIWGEKPKCICCGDLIADNFPATDHDLRGKLCAECCHRTVLAVRIMKLAADINGCVDMPKNRMLKWE